VCMRGSCLRRNGPPAGSSAEYDSVPIKTTATTAAAAPIVLNNAAIDFYTEATRRWERCTIAFFVFSSFLELALLLLAHRGAAPKGCPIGAVLPFSSLIAWSVKRQRYNERMLHIHLSLAQFSNGTLEQQDRVLETVIGATEKRSFLQRRTRALEKSRTAHAQRRRRTPGKTRTAHGRTSSNKSDKQRR
jgi:hypothetical protein